VSLGQLLAVTRRSHRFVPRSRARQRATGATARVVPSRIRHLGFLVSLLVGALGCSAKDAPAGGGSGGSAGNGVAASGGRNTMASGGSAHAGTADGGRAGSGASGGTVAGGGAATGSGGAGGIASGGSAGNGSSGNGGLGGGTAGGSPSAGAANGGGSAGGNAPGGAAGLGAGGGSAGASDTVDATAMAKTMGFGANIGNTLENTTTWETGWGQPLITQAFIDGMASHGIKNVRVPVAWDTYAKNGVVDSAKMDRVKQVVGWIEAAGMYSILNIHWDGGWIDNDTDGNANRYKLTDDVKTKFASYWTQIATAFSSVGHKLIFEALNEESKFYVNGDTSQPDYAPLNTLNQLFVTTVRAQSGYNKTRALLIAGFTTDIALTCVDAFAIPSDPAGTGKLFLSVHYYTPYTFCGLDTVESWGSPKTTWGTTAEKQELTDLFDELGAFSTQRKIPVIIGEFGVTLGQSYPREQASRVLWMESVAKAALSRGMVPVLWDTATDISRNDGSFSSALQTVMSDIQ
jgi:endoglucanase